MNKTMLLFTLFFPAILFAQKKVLPASHSVLTGLELPAGSKKDDRLLSVSGASVLLEMESKKVNTTVSKTEVLLLPPISAGGINKDTLMQMLSAKGWTSTPVNGEENYAWLKKGTRYVIVYFSTGAKESSFYLAEANSAPDFNKSMTASPQVNKSNQTVQNNPENYGNSSTVTGTWVKSASVNLEYGDAASFGNSGYSKDQYTFFDNGTYNFVTKIFRYINDKLLLILEAGTYQINGNLLIIYPQSNVIESWSKKDGVDKFGKLLSRENRTLEKVTYRFTKHYFTGIQQWNLVLQANEATKRDGPYSNNKSFEKAWYYKPISGNDPAIELPENESVVLPQPAPVNPVSNPGFSFTTTNFDDGWKVTEQSDWVHVSKNGIVVLIYYAQPDIKGFNNIDESTAFVWNTIFAPGYSNISNLWIRKSWYADGDFMNVKYFSEADLTGNGNRKKVHIVLYKSGNGGKWI